MGGGNDMMNRSAIVSDQNALNLSQNKMSAFESKMAKFSRKSNAGPALQGLNTGTDRRIGTVTNTS